MSRQNSRLRMIAGAAAIGIALGFLAAPADVRAADLDTMFVHGTPPMQPVEFGTGWYIRGDLSGAYQTQPSLSPDFTSVPAAHSLNWGGELGGGYQFNKWFRVDGTFTYYGKQQVKGNGPQVNCPSEIRGLYDLGAGGVQTPIGVDADGNMCTPRQSAYLQKSLFLVNGYVDLGNWWGVTPYVGAGVGAAYITAQQNVNFYNNSDGSPYRATLTFPTGYPSIFYSPNGLQQGSPLNPQPHYNYGQQNWDYSRTSQKWNFAFALMAGVSYNVTDHIILDLGYRYVNFGSFSGISSLSGELFNKQVTTQEIRLGLRYQID